MIWRIGQFPELKDLDHEERKAVFASLRWWLYPLMVLRSIGFAGLTTLVVAVLTVLFTVARVFDYPQ